MRGLAAALALTILSNLAGCGASWLSTTLFHAPLPEGATPSEGDWIRFADSGATTPTDALAALAPVGDDEWLAWTTRAEGGGTLLLARRTALGLEAQAIGDHDGPSVRPTLRALALAPTRVFVVESSSAATSTERVAWLYVEDHGRIVPIGVDEGPARVRVRAEQRTQLAGGWYRASTFTATLEASERELVVHEHASVRELATERPELAARSTYEVERARTLRWVGGSLRSDRPSLFDAPD